MVFNKNKFSKVIKRDFGGSMRKCAEGLKIAPSTLCRIYNEDHMPSARTIEKIVKYCNEMGYDCTEFISFKTCS